MFYNEYKQKENNKLNLGAKEKKKDIENIITLSKEEIIYMKYFNDKHCFIIQVEGDIIANKAVLDINLEILKKHTLELFELKKDK